MREIKFRAWHKNNKSMCQNATTDLLDRDYLEFMQFAEQNDINRNEIYEGDIIHQVVVLPGSPNIDFTGEVKFYDGSWWVDNGKEAILLFNEACENEIIGNKFQGW